MKESTRTWLPERYQSVCRERGWLGEKSESRLWSRREEERAEVARELFGLALLTKTHGAFCAVREGLETEALQGTRSSEQAREV